jgi:predicted  nucleic acid-binding Zn-ribbon protein
MNTLLLLILRVLSTMRAEARINRRILMSVISDFAAKQQAFNQRQGAAIDGAVASLQGLTDDVAALNKKIEELQNSTGGVTPEDQALIDDLQTQGDAVAQKAESLATALQALDQQTPPTPPPA